MDNFALISSAAHDGAFGKNSRPEPSLAQLRAGTYAKGRCTLYGLKIAIETPQGHRRAGKANGEPWSVICQAHYGYIEKTRGADGDELDVFIGPWPESERVWVVNRGKPDGGFEEHKILLAFPDAESAITAYRNSYERGSANDASVVPCTIDQLKWWIAYGNHAVPLTTAQLPYDGTAAMNDVTWDSTATPIGMTVPSLLYAIRHHDAADHLLLDAVTAADILEASDGEAVLDALVVPLNRLERKLAQMQVIMRAAAKGVKPVAAQITPPFKQRGTTNVAAIIEMSDGQTVSIYFHNPDTTPNKLTPDDEMVSWKWMLNKKDVTIVVAPERGQELNPREVARRIMRLVEANSARFQKANTRRSERMASIEATKTGIAEKEARLAALDAEIDSLEVQVEAKRNKPPAELQKGDEGEPGPGEKDGSASISESTPAEKFRRLEPLAEAFGAGKPQFYGVIQSDGADLKDDFMPETDNKQMAMAMGQIAKEHGYAFAFQISVGKPDTPFRCVVVMYEDGRGIGSQFAATPAEAFDMLPAMTPIPAATFDPEARMREVRDAMGRLGWHVSPGYLEMTVRIDGSMYGIKADTTDTSVRWMDTGSDRVWENDPSLTADQMAAKIDSEFRGAIEAAKASVGRPAWMDVDPTTEAGYAIVREAGESALLYHQDQLDHFFNERYIAIRNALRAHGWDDGGSGVMKKDGGYRFGPKIESMGAGRNIVGMSYEIKGVPGFFMSDTLANTPEQMAEKINMGLPQAKNPDPIMVGVVAALELAGWSRGDGTAIATKSFNSLNGEQQALAFLSEGDGYNRTLSFEFTSEGRNVAAADLVLIPITATREEAKALSAQAAERAEKSIRESYAVRMADEDDPVVEEAVRLVREAKGGIAKLATSFYFTFNFDGEDMIFDADLRAKVEAALGEKVKKVTLPGLEGQVSIVPESYGDSVSSDDIAEMFGAGQINEAFAAYNTHRVTLEEPERDINEFASWAFDQKQFPLWDLSTKIVKGWSQQEFEAAEYALEDWNFNSENTLLLAKRVGSADDVKEAKGILREHRKSSIGISQELYAKRGELSKKLRAKASPASQTLPYTEYLQSVISGTTDLSDPSVADKLTALYEAHNGNQAFDEMFAKAADAYQAFMVEAAKKALGN